MFDIALDGVKKSYGDQVVFDGQSFIIRAGECTVLMGPSGCGKTTLLRILMGLEKADGGEVFLVDRGLHDRRVSYDPSSLRLSAVFQEDRLVMDRSVSWNILLAIGGFFWGRAKRARLEADLERLGLVGVLDKPVKLLSGGMRRRVALLRALAVDADLYFLDEPFVGLDVESKKMSIAFCGEKLAGKTVVMVTHDRMEAFAMGGNVVHFIMTDERSGK